MNKIRGFERIQGYEDIPLPKRSTTNAAGYDICAAEDIKLLPFKLGDKPYLIPTGLKVYMQDNEWLMLANRSSGPKKGLLFPHSMGIIDSDYYQNPQNDGHLFVQVINILDKDIDIKKGDVIAQGVFMNFLIADNDVKGTARKGGFGSTD